MTQLGRASARENADLVSVVIPCYKLAHFLGDAIESVLRQSYPHREIIVVNDGSPDNTAEVSARYPEVRYIRQENQGVAEARNTGLRAVRGSYVVFIDADDRLLPRALEAGLHCLRAHPECAFVIGQHEFIAADGTLLSRDSHPFVERDHYAELLRDTYIVLPGTVMYRRDVFESVGGFDGSVFPAEDYQLYLRIARDWPIRCHLEVVAQYRKHSTNQSGNPERMLKAALSAYRSHWYRVKGDARYEEVTGLELSTSEAIMEVCWPPRWRAARVTLI